MDPAETKSSSEDAEMNNSDQLAQTSTQVGVDTLRAETDSQDNENGLGEELESLVEGTNAPIDDGDPFGNGNSSDPSKEDVDGDTGPSCEGVGPSAEGSVPPAEGTDPTAKDTDRTVEGTGHSAEGTVPAAEGTDPQAQGTGPPAEGSDSPAEGSDPPAEGSDPLAEGSGPPAEGSDPPAEGSDPSAEGSDSPAEGTPPVKGTGPPAESSDSPAEGTDSTVEDTDSTFEGTDPTVEGTDPPAETSDPPANSSGPPAEGSDPPAEGTDPTFEGTDPPAEKTDYPKEGTESSRVSANPSRIDTGPIVMGTDPRTDGAEVLEKDTNLSESNFKSEGEQAKEQNPEKEDNKAVLTDDKITEDSSKSNETSPKVVLAEHTGQVVSIGGDVLSNDTGSLVKEESFLMTTENKVGAVEGEVQSSTLSGLKQDGYKQNTEERLTEQNVENVTDTIDRKGDINIEENLGSEETENNSKVQNLEVTGDNGNACSSKENLTTLETGPDGSQEVQREKENSPKEQSNSQNTRASNDTKSETDRVGTGTPESVGVSVDLTVTESHMTTTDDRLRLPPSRYSERTIASTSFTYNDLNDFPTPDYDQFLRPTPSAAGSEKDKDGRRTSSKLKSAATSRGEGTKSVTFADNLIPKDGDVKGKVNDEDKNATSEVGQSSESVFQTAVSEEKIAEATNKLKSQSTSSITSTDSLLIEVFGSVKIQMLKAVDVLGKRANEHYEKGCHLALLGDHYSAINCFDKAINLHPNQVRFYLMRGESYLLITDFQSAIQNFKKACVLRPTNDLYYSKLAFVYYLKGQTLFDQCLFTEALEAFSRAAEMKPDVIGYHTRSVACLASLERHGECLALVNKRLETETSNPDLYIMRARLHLLFRNTSLCYYDLKDALALNPDQEEAQQLLKELVQKAEDNRNLAVKLQLQSKFKEAMQKITVAIDMNPMVAGYHLFRGAIHRRLHDFSAAIDDFLLALDKTDHNEQSHIYMDAQRQLLLTYNDFAIDCFLGGHFEESILLLNKAIKGEKREKGLYINRGDCFFRLNDLHFALADYHQALELDEDPLIRGRIAAIHSEFGLMDYEEHSYQDAEARFTVAIKHNPLDGQFYLNRAKVRFMLENQAGARTDLLVALHINPSNGAILSLLARLFPGKTIQDVMKSKAAKEAKLALDNAMVTASPIRLPSITRSADALGAQAGISIKNSDNPSSAIMLFMSEDDFDKLMAKKKKRIKMEVKSTFLDRQMLKNTAPRLKPHPPLRTYEVRGGHWKNEETQPPPGWRQFGLGITMKDA